MPELGGPTTQSGILFQNSVAALYLGQLVDPRPVPNGQRVTAVRVEAPEYIDDIAVTLGNGCRLLIQAKELLTVGSGPWSAFWKDLNTQVEQSNSETDDFLLLIGNYTQDLNDLRELCERRRGKESLGEWLDALSQRHKEILTKIVSASGTDEARIFNLVRRLSVQFLPLNQIETVGVRDKIPASSTRAETLFSILRDLCGGAARVRASFSPRSLTEALATGYSIKLNGVSGDGLESYLRAVENKYFHISVPGTPFRGSHEELWVAPTLTLTAPSHGRDFEEESYGAFRPYYLEPYSEPLNPADFPKQGMTRILIEAGAGFGKSSTLGMIARRLATQKVYVPVVILAQALATSTGIAALLEEHINRDFRTSIDWTTLLHQGRAVMLIDGLDELGDEARTSAIEHIRQAVAIFPEAPFIVTTRDGASMPLTAVFSCYKIKRLDDYQQLKLLRCYLALRPEIDAEYVCNELQPFGELTALCSIPLFLALLVATMPISGALPKSRSELLERYLAIALAPQQHRTVARPRLPLSKLRAGAEALALAALKRHEIAVPEAIARAKLNEHIGFEYGDACVEDLIQCGLIVRRGFRIGFAIATVQEYLAGCAVSGLLEADLSDWFSNAARRPWAQALQFAIERADGIEPALIAQLEADDDVFFTSLRIIARSIANGATVSKAFRNRIVDRVLSIWTGHGWRIERSVDQLLLDGLAFPPPQKLLRLLETNRPTFAYSQLILQIGDHELTLRALENVLGRSDIRVLWSAKRVDAIKPVATRALPMLLEKSNLTDDLSVSVIASVVYGLRDLEEIDWLSVTHRNDLPTAVRVAALWGAGQENTSDGRQAIEAYLNEASTKSVWEKFPEAYFATQWWQAHFCNVIFGPPQTAKHRASIFARLIDLPVDENDDGNFVISFLIGVLGARPDGISPLFEALLLAASFGVEAYGIEAIARLKENGEYHFGAWTRYAGYFSESIRLAGIHAVRPAMTGRNNESGAISDLLMRTDHVPSGKRSSLLPRGPFISVRARTPSTQAIAEWAEDYLIRCKPPIAKEGMLRARLIEVGFGDTSKLSSMLTSYANSAVTMNSEHWSWVITAVHALDGLNYKIAPDLLWKLAEISTDFPTDSFYSILIEMEGSRCGERLSRTYRLLPQQRRQILSALADIAPAKGISVKVNDDHLILRWLN